jgi:predicted MFS family arabinose efflux permease
LTSEASAIPLGADAAAETIAVAPTTLSTGTRGRILIYLSVLILLLGFGSPSGGLIDVPVSFFLKNKLHLSAHQVAEFRLVAGIPLYLSVVFGLTRDTWNPLGMHDRGYMVLFGAITAVLFVLFAFMPFNEPMLLGAMILLTAGFLFVSSAQNGLMAQVGQQHVMSGQVSTVFNTVASVPILAALALGGVLSQQLEGRNGPAAERILFLTGAAVMAAVAVFGLLRPRSVYDNLHKETGPRANVFGDLRRLASYWPVYPALLIWGLWNFAPGAQTPLQFYLQDTLHSSDAVWGYWNSIFAASFIPTFLLYGWLSQRYPLRPLLWWGAVVAAPQMVPLLFIHDPAGALIAAIPIGLMGGVCSAAYTDLLIRSCPRGLQGATLMAAGSLFYVASRFGDILGTNLYDHFHDFKVCVIAITVVYTSILLVLLVVPKRLTETADGEAPEGGFATQ